MKFIKSFESHDPKTDVRNTRSVLQELGFYPSYYFKLDLTLPLMEGEFSNLNDLFRGVFHVEVAVEFDGQKLWSHKILEKIAEQKFDLHSYPDKITRLLSESNTQKKLIKLAAECLKRPHRETGFKIIWPPDAGYPNYFTECENPLVYWAEGLALSILEAQCEKNGFSNGEEKKSFLDFCYSRSRSEFLILEDSIKIRPGSEMWITHF
jgi:hypothetical protein